MVWIIVGGIVVVLIIIGMAIEAAKERKKQAYLTSLEALKTDPSNATLRQTTLQLGRIYSEATRNNKGITMFDEVALMNDIGAACAGAAHIAPSTTPVVQGTSIQDRLRKLKEMRDDGLIDDDDFAKKKQELMDEL